MECIISVGQRQRLQTLISAPDISFWTAREKLVLIESLIAHIMRPDEPVHVRVGLDGALEVDVISLLDVVRAELPAEPKTYGWRI